MLQRPSRRLRRALTLAATAALLSACGSGSGAGTKSTGGTPDGDGPVPVVASTDVWGDVVQAVGGADVEVTSLISDPAQDPHSFESNARNLLAVKNARVVLANGGGYDDFMDRMVSASRSHAAVLSAVAISGHTAPAGGELNEHVWYDFPTVVKVAQRVAAELSTADAAHATDYAKRADAFVGRIGELEQREKDLRAAHAGTAVAVTEPVPGWLLSAAGLVDRSPTEFSEAIEEGDDVAPAVLRQTLELVREHRVAALVYNEQTAGPTTEQVLDAATDAGVPVVPVTETLPAGKDYLSWMSANLTALTDALATS